MVLDVFKAAPEGANQAAATEVPDTTQVVEIVPPTALGALERAQIDIQIATAKQFPRTISQSIEKAKTLVCHDPIIAAACRYSVPKAGGHITGNSIRLAEPMAISWGNLRYGGRIISVDARTVTAQGVCHDLETNAAVSVEAVRSIITSEGKRFSDDMIRTTCMAAIKIGIRNAIFTIIPQGYVDQVGRAAQKVARGEEKGLEVRRGEALAFFKEKGIPQDKVFIALGVAAAEDITWNHIDRLLQYATAITVEGIDPKEIFGETAPATADAPPEEPKTPSMSYDEAINELGVAGCSWDMLYTALGLSDAGEMTDTHKAKVVELAQRVAAGETLEQVLAAPPPSPAPGPPAGEQAFGAKAAAQDKAAAAAATPETDQPKTELDF